MIDVEKIIMFNEHSRLEAKKALGGIPESLWESYSAFANTEGGIILLGVSEVDSSLVVTGVKEGQKKIKTIWDILNNRGKISANVLMEKHIYIQRVNDCDVIVIDVPRADRHDKPVYINNDLFEGTYRRYQETFPHAQLFRERGRSCGKCGYQGSACQYADSCRLLWQTGNCGGETER